jgi:hypothetical protein
MPHPLRMSLIAFISLGALSLSGVAGAQIVTSVNSQIFTSPSGQPFRAPADKPYPVAAWFAAADADKDGKISHEEFDNDAKAFFLKLDTSKDGYINSPENTVYETRLVPEITRLDPRVAQPKNYRAQNDPEMGVDQDPTKGRYQKSLQGAAQYGLINEPQPVRGADGNIDFRVSGAEWMNATNQRFEILDKNADGFLTVDELPKTPLQIALEAPKDAKGKDGKGKGDKKKRFGW